MCLIRTDVPRSEVPHPRTPVKSIRIREVVIGGGLRADHLVRES
jgi:hypothetical protein